MSASLVGSEMCIRDRTSQTEMTPRKQNSLEARLGLDVRMHRARSPAARVVTLREINAREGVATGEGLAAGA
eukprot:4878473-Alexandrium_andersonii.AAC.1